MTCANGIKISLRLHTRNFKLLVIWNASWVSFFFYEIEISIPISISCWFVEEKSLKFAHNLNFASGFRIELNQSQNSEWQAKMLAFGQNIMDAAKRIHFQIRCRKWCLVSRLFIHFVKIFTADRDNKNLTDFNFAVFTMIFIMRDSTNWS